MLFIMEGLANHKICEICYLLWMAFSTLFDIYILIG